VNESLLRETVPAVIGVLVRRGADFAAAEDAVQEALPRGTGRGAHTVSLAPLRAAPPNASD
jgi:DNA-directed RNA polymerase specialized sigma24 family protein